MIAMAKAGQPLASFIYVRNNLVPKRRHFGTPPPMHLDSINHTLRGKRLGLTSSPERPSE